MTALAAAAVTCEICACAPCLTPGFCEACRAADARPRPQQRATELRRAAQSTFDALVWELRTHGIAQLAKPNVVSVACLIFIQARPRVDCSPVAAAAEVSGHYGRTNFAIRRLLWRLTPLLRQWPVFAASAKSERG